MRCAQYLFGVALVVLALVAVSVHCRVELDFEVTKSDDCKQIEKSSDERCRVCCQRCYMLPDSKFDSCVCRKSKRMDYARKATDLALLQMELRNKAGRL